MFCGGGASPPDFAVKSKVVVESSAPGAVEGPIAKVSVLVTKAFTVSVARTTKLKIPATCGDPLTTPAELSDRPGGRADAVSRLQV